MYKYWKGCDICGMEKQLISKDVSPTKSISNIDITKKASAQKADKAESTKATHSLGINKITLGKKNYRYQKGNK